MGESLRLFFAVPLEEALRDAACDLQQRLARACRPGPRVKWVERDNLHLTLKFLGERPADVLEEIGRVAGEVAVSAAPLTLEVGGVGCFPPRGAPRTIWLGLLRECPELEELAQALDRALAAAGLAEPEERAFRPHFTLGRVKERGGAGELRRAIAALAEAPVGTMTVEHLDLLSSELTPRGPVYTECRRFRLGG